MLTLGTIMDDTNSNEIFYATKSIKNVIRKFTPTKYEISTVTPTEIKDYTICSVWCKTLLITGGEGGAGVDPLSCITGTFILSSFSLSVPIY